MLKSDFIPVAIDQWYERKQKDAKGEFYRKIAGQGPRNNFSQTTQGRYVCDAEGNLLAFNNNRGPEKIRAMMKAVLKEWKGRENVQPIQATQLDPEFDVRPPSNGLVLRVNAKVLSGYEHDPKSWKVAFEQSISRDNAWFTEQELTQLTQRIQQGGELPKKLMERVARFHLIDNTRGEPPRWRKDQIKQLKVSIDQGGKITGSVHLETADGKRGFVAKLLGVAQTSNGELKRFDLVAKGQFWGRGRFTGHAPEGKFPLAIAFRMADGTDPADNMIPHGAKGWVDGYYNN